MKYVLLGAVLLPLSAGLALTVAAFVMAASRGWRAAMENRAGGGRSLPRKLLLAGTGLAFGELLLVGLAAAVLYVPYHRDRVAAATAKRLGGRVRWSEGGPAWLRKELGDEWMRPLDRVWGVQLRGPHVRDEHVRVFAGLTELRQLELFDTSVTDTGLAHLHDLPGLWRLSLAGTRVRGPGLRHLRGLTSLKVLRPEDSAIDDAGAEGLAGLPPSLVTLDLDGTAISDRGLAHLPRLPRLERLSLAETRVRGPGLARLSVPALEHLNLSGSRLDDAGAAGLAHLPPSLGYLQLSFTSIGDDGLRHLPALPELTELTLDECPVRGPGLRHLAGMTRLEHLSLRRAPVEDAGLASLPRLPSLKRIDLRETPVGEAGVATLADLPALDALWLTETAATGRGLDAPDGFARLETVFLSGTAAADDAIPILIRLPSLTWVGLHRTAVTAEAVGRLKEARPGLIVHWAPPEEAP